ncbi:hypothetical protein CMI47_13700 [Candidatus Pacearchaeota archaeon]|nr:hypothetical protein [Candidatus Pacearchaeota archaeon]
MTTFSRVGNIIVNASEISQRHEGDEVGLTGADLVLDVYGDIEREKRGERVDWEERMRAYRTRFGYLKGLDGRLN